MPRQATHVPRPGGPRSDSTSAKLLRRFRLLAGLTQDELGARSGYSGDYIRKLEGGRRRLTRAALAQIAEVLALTPREREELLAATQAADHELVRTSAGRAHELSEIRRLLAGLGAPVLLFSGEPGIGKTHLLEQAAMLAAQSGWTVVRGGCQRRAQDPYAPLTDALADSVQRLPPKQRQAALSRAGRLELLLPEHRASSSTRRPSETNPSPPLPADQERRLLFAAVADYLQVVGGEQGVLLVLDDLQWAGPDALDLLGALVQNPRTNSLRLIGVYRDSETPSDAPLAAFVADLAPAGLVHLRGLDPLSDDEARHLLGQLLPDDEAVRRTLLPAIMRRAGGVPLFLVSYAEDLREARGDSADLELPWTVAQLIRQRVVALPEPVRQVLGIASVIGREVPAPLVAGITGQSEAATLKALDAAADARLLQQAADGTYRFRHDLVREAIEKDLSVGQRQLTHRCIGEALARQGERNRAARLTEIAWHFVQGADPQRAVAWSLRAGDRAASVFAYGEAERHYQMAAELAQETEDAAAELDALEKLGGMRQRLGRYPDTIEPLERAAAICERLCDRNRQLGIQAQLGEAYGFAGRAAEGIDRVQAILQAEECWSGAQPSAAMADLYATLCSLHVHCLQAREALEVAEKAVSISAAAGNLHALCRTEISRGIALELEQRLDEERQAFERAARIAEPLGDPWLLALAVYHHGVSHVRVDEVEQGLRHVRRAVDVADRAGLVAWASFARANLARTLIGEGLWIEARSVAERAVADSRTLGVRPGATVPLVVLGQIQLLLGEREAGLLCLNEALDVATRFNYLFGLTEVQPVLALLDVREGHPAEAIARLEPLLERARRAGLPWPPTVYIRALADTGHWEQAAEALHATRGHAKMSTSRAGLPDLLLQAGRLASLRGHTKDALGDLEEGLSIARELGRPYDEALLLEEYALTDPAGGTKPYLEKAQALFQQIGARPDIERVAAFLEAIPFTES